MEHREQRWLWLLIVTIASLEKIRTIGGEVIQEFEISEGVPVGTSIGSIGKPISGSPHPPPPPPYLIVPVPGSSVDSDLTIDQSTGEILTRIQLDRETRDSYSLVAIPMTGENIRVIIRVKDENDHAPEFPSPFMHVEFPENTPRDVKRTLQPARDKDLGIYNTQRYTISAGNLNNAFRLSSHRERDGVLYLDLQVNGFLDRETTPSYSLLIDAFDGGVPPLKGSMSINITITDQNDNAPIWQFPRFSNSENYHGENDDITFNQSRYFATVPENATVGTSVLQVFATDIDEGPNGQVSYSINRRQTDKDSVFRIDRTTGVISVNGPLDFETKEVYELVVVARDNGIQPLETTVFVSIRVLDLNDNQMEINISFFSGDSDDAPPKVSEKALPGEFVARISVIDPDSKQEYNNVSITLLGGDGDFALETVNNAVYLIVASRKLDRERKPSFTLTVIATDKANPYLNASTKFTLQVEDDNDSAPKFEVEEYHSSVLETAEPGTVVVQVKARDEDYGDNARVTYELIQTSQTHSDWFQINEDSGVITTKAYIDCEIDPTPRLTVVAKDHGKPALSGSATVFVHLIDTNDTPIFDQGFYNASVVETAPYGTCLLKVSASDPDCGVNAELAYNLLESPSTELPFSVNPKSGEICVSGPLDYEKKDVYQILVTASDTGGLTSTAVVNIQLIDENDNIPKFNPSSYSVSVREGTVPSEPIVSVAAVDGDSGKFGKITYSIEDGNDAGLFSIEKNSGDISMIRGASKIRPIHRLRVTGKDGDNHSAEQSAEVTVHIVGTEFQAPVFQKPRYSFIVSEDIGPQSTVGTVSASGNGRVRYSVTSGDPKSLFSIDSYTGVIKTSSRLDHEEQPVFRLNIQAKLDQHEVISYCQVEIRVNDVNDNAPKFGSTQLKIWVPETAEVGSIVFVAFATDEDSGTNGEIVYFAVSNPYGIFKLDKNGLLTVQRPLDYESFKEYTVVIGARDNGSPQRRSENLTLQIEVQDSNDNAPVWYKTRYEFWIRDRSPAGTYVGRVTKRDKNPSGAIKFQLQPSYAGFRIDPDSGVINTTMQFYRNISSHELTVVAYNQIVTQQKAVFKVLVHIGDLGSKGRSKSESDEPDSGVIHYSINVTESLEIDSEIMQVVALDEDVGNNARISYKIDEPALQNIIDVYPTTGILYLKSSLDREIQDRYIVKVVAMDHGVPPLSSTSTIHLTVVDENDNSPKFEQEMFQFSLRENNAPGTVIGKVTAHDRDSGENGSIKYYFQPAHEDFAVDSISGKITAKSSLDREKQSLYELQAVAVDQGNPPQQSEVIVQVTLTDENDNEPQIVEPDHDFLTVREHLPAGTEVARLLANDPDDGKNSKISYSLINDGFTDGDDFAIDSESGVIKTKKVLIRDSKTFYTLRVKARDGGSPSRDSSREYRIEVLDVNDKRLDSLFVPSKLLFKVSENVTVGHVVGSVIANLDEKDEKPQVNYMITGGNTHDSFEIHATSGSIVVANELNYEETSHYIIQVKALLKTTSNVRVSVISVEIAILDVNDEHAKFAQDPTIFSVSESTPIGTPVWNFTAVDSDGGLNGILHYNISHQEPFDKFRINMLTGSLYLQSQLDYETCSSYMLIVTATDQSQNINRRLNSSVTVNIMIHDENDNAPFFTSPNTIDIYELEPLKTAFHTVIAKDLDSTENGYVSYHILSGNDEGIFNLNSENGRLSLSKPLKRDVKRYSLNISATDQGRSPNVAAQVLSITVKADQNHSPRFSSPRYEGKIVENSAVGTQVLKVMAIRGDLDRNASLRYLIPEGLGDGKFKIHPTTGFISVAGPIDREQEDEYSLMVYVQDDNQLYVYDTTTVIIRVLDDNDNAPNFHDSCTPLTVPENNELGVIHVFTAEDPDEGKNGEVSFAIAAGNVENMFNVDLHTGKLTGRPLDRERRAHYHLLIAAQDQGNPSRKTTCNLTISVDDENDSPITFVAPTKAEEQSLLRSISSPGFRETQSGQPIYSASIPENVPIGTTVLKVQANDADIGVNSIIKYSLNNESHWHFTIDNTTGSIVTAGALDREKISSYMFEVAATDGGLYDSRSSTASVHFTITDNNDNRPQFRDNPIVAKIPPYTKPGQNIVQAVAVDADEGINADVNYSLESSDSEFNINSQTGQISPVTSLTADRGRIFHLKVVATDQGAPSMSSTALVVIQVGEIDPQNILKFQESEYKTDILENSPAGTEVLKVIAVRNDGRRARIHYSIVGGNEDGIFEIVPNAGLIRIKDPTNLDREKESKFKLVISAKAEGSPPQFAHTVAQVTLLDVNDNFPRFTQESYIASVWEGNTKGTFVTQVTATDNDEGSNANVLYHIIDGNRDNAFVIEPPFSGIVKTNIVLDREIQDEYRLTIIATDEGSPQMTGTCFLHVNVIDIQDQSPVFPPHSVISVKEDVPVGTLITTMIANDVDTNPTLVYGFTEKGNPENMFSIGKYSGRVTLVKPLDYEATKSYTAKVQVSDSVHTAYTTLTVNVLDSNDHRPLFSNDVYKIMVSEGTKVGSKVGQVNATDEDSGKNGVVKYSLRNPKGLKSPGSGFIRIDEDSGVIYLNGSAVYKSENPFSQLIVVAKDKGKPAKTSEATVWVEIRPSSSHILRFSQSKYRAKIDKSTKPGTVITQLLVERTDKLSKSLHYHISIASGNDGEFFSVNSHNGQVLLAKKLTKNVEEPYVLVLSADCVNMEQCSSVTELVIEVSSTANAGPIFEKSNYKIVVSESKPVGSNLIKLQATDTKSNGTVVYDITSGNNQDIVELNRNTGVLSLKRSLDYDSVDHYTFVVRAQDGSDKAKVWNLTTVELTLEDDNDHEPKFLFSQYVGMVGENEPIGTTVCTVRATDLDKGIYGKLQYSILDGDGKDKFVIAPSTGVVTTNTVFDYEAKSRYYVTVRANDIGGKSSTAKLQIEIESRDEFPPQFVQKSYKFEIPGNAEPGHIIGRVEAMDQDRGPDGRLVYQTLKPNGILAVNRTNGVIVLKTVPNADINSTITIMASSGRPGSKSVLADAEIVLGEPLKELEVASSAMTDWVLGLLGTTLLLLFIICAVFLLLHLKNKKQSKKGKEEAFQSPNFDTLDYAPTTMRIGSTKPDSIYGSHYGNLMDIRGNDRRRMNNTISELSDQSNSASSGRGSAEDGEEVEDEEICMINEGTLAQQQLRGAGILDSGIQDDDDNASQTSAKNTQEYLARLGIRPKVSEGSQHDSQSEWGLSHNPHNSDGLDNLHLYNDKDGRGVDISALIYAQISDDLNHSVSEDKSSVSYKNVPQPSVTGSLSSIVHNEEELAGSYNWDYLLDWGPQYQPLAHVFSEIAYLKEDSSNRSEPQYCGIHSRNVSSNQSSEKGTNHQNFVGSVGSSRGTNAPRTGPLPPLPILPRSPIPNDISFASGPISPSFSPALSPLANRSPSISPLGGVTTNNIRPSQFHESCRTESDLGM